MVDRTSYSFDPTILRAYDVRGIVGETLSVTDAKVLGQVFGSVVREKGGSVVCVGYDGRVSSPDLEYGLVEGLSSVGISVKRVGLGPTPMLYFATKRLDADAGIMITGSHNPPTHNGFKMMLSTGPFYGDQITNLGHRAKAGDWIQDANPGSVMDVDVSGTYLDTLDSAYMGSRDVSPEDLTVVWDPGNGAAGEVMQALAKRLPGHHVVINAEIDGTFPNHHPDPTVAENLRQLQSVVAQEKAHIGIAFDGDGDRIGAIDSQGQIIWGDQLLTIYAREVLAHAPGATIVADVKTSQVTFDEIHRMGGEPLMWRTGHSPIKEIMAERNAPLAGEMSGHVFFADRYYGFDDALYAGVRLLNACRSGRGVDDIMDALPKAVNTPEIRVDVADERKFEIMENIKQAVLASAADDPHMDVMLIDGVRVQSSDGWWLIRASNTQSAISVRCEAPTEPQLQKILNDVSVLLETFDVQLND